MNHAIQGVAFAAIATPLILQFLKAYGPQLASDKLPFIAAAMGVLLTMGAGFLLGQEFNRSLILSGVIGAFGPSGVYELATKAQGK